MEELINDITAPAQQQDYQTIQAQLGEINVFRLTREKLEDLYKLMEKLPETVLETDMKCQLFMMQVCSVLGYDEEVDRLYSFMCRLRGKYVEGSQRRTELEVFLSLASTIRSPCDNAQLLLAFSILFNEYKCGNTLPVKMCPTGNRPSILSGRSDISEWGKHFRAVASILEPMLPVLMQGDSKSIIITAVSEQLYERNKLEECNIELANAVSAPDVNIAFAALILQARLSRLEINSTRYKRILEHIGGLIEQNKADWLLENYKAAVLRFDILDGNTEAVQRWVDELPYNELTSVNMQNSYVMDTLARANIALSHLAEAVTVLEKLTEMNKRYGRHYDLIDCYIHSAIAFKAIGKNDLAAERLSAALTHAMPFGFVRIFADKGRVLFNMLLEYKKAAEQDGTQSRGMLHYLSAILDAAKDVALIFPNLYASNVRAESEKPELTDSELQILTMLADGKTNQQIGEALGIKLATVKFHIGNLLKKYNVTNRTSLVSAYFG